MHAWGQSPRLGTVPVRAFQTRLGTVPFRALDKIPVKKHSILNARLESVPKRAFLDNFP